MPPLLHLQYLDTLSLEMACMDNHCHPIDTHLQMHGCFPAFHVSMSKLSCVEPGHLSTTLVKRPTVKYNRMQIKNEIFDERCKVLHTELKINTKVGTRVQCPERASLNANGRKCLFQ